MSDHTSDAAVTRVRHDGGLRFSATIRDHTVVMDQPLSNGGEDTAASPMELLSAALGGCAALYVHQFCAARGIADDGMSVDVITENARKPYRVGRFAIRVTLPPGFPDEYRAAVERAVMTCPVHNTFLHPPAVELDIAVGVYEGVDGAVSSR